MKNPILIQGAMDMETERLLNSMKEPKEINIQDYLFYKGKINDLDIIISKTKVGLINAAIATTIAIKEFSPKLVINQGVAGSHRDDIHRGDIVLGEKSAHINSFITCIKNNGEGSDPFSWKFDSRALEKIDADENLINIATNVEWNKGNIFVGTLGSGNIFNREVDRIEWIHQKQGTFCEDNESIAVYTTCKVFNIPCIGIRIIGNNEKTQTKNDGATVTRKNDGVVMITRQYDEKPAYIVQDFVLKFIKSL